MVTKTVKKKIKLEAKNPKTGKALKAEVTMAVTKKINYTEAWAEIKVPIGGREIVYGAAAKVSASTSLDDVQDGIFYDCLVNVNDMIARLQKQKKST